MSPREVCPQCTRLDQRQQRPAHARDQGTGFLHTARCEPVLTTWLSLWNDEAVTVSWMALPADSYFRIPLAWSIHV